MNDPNITIIERRKGLFQVNFSEIYQYRSLLWMMVARDVISKFKQTLLGPLWYFIQPLLASLVLGFVFSRFAKLPTGGVPPFLFYYTGLISWYFFASSLQGASMSFFNSSQIISKVFFPRILLPLSAVMSAGFAWLFQFIILLLLIAYHSVIKSTFGEYHIFKATIVLPTMIYIAVIAFASGLLLASASVKYRDFFHAIGFIIQLLLFMTPVFYPLEMVPESYWPIYGLNPLVAPFEMLRSALLQTSWPPLNIVLLSISSSIVLLLAGLVVYSRNEQNIVDTI
jgi:lipopolysaccharide transport system permease protein